MQKGVLRSLQKPATTAPCAVHEHQRGCAAGESCLGSMAHPAENAQVAGS